MQVMQSNLILLIQVLFRELDDTWNISLKEVIDEEFTVFAGWVIVMDGVDCRCLLSSDMAYIKYTLAILYLILSFVHPPDLDFTLHEQPESVSMHVRRIIARLPDKIREQVDDDYPDLVQ